MLVRSFKFSKACASYFDGARQTLRWRMLKSSTSMAYISHRGFDDVCQALRGRALKSSTSVAYINHRRTDGVCQALRGRVSSTSTAYAEIKHFSGHRRIDGVCQALRGRTPTSFLKLYTELVHFDGVSQQVSNTNGSTDGSGEAAAQTDVPEEVNYYFKLRQRARRRPFSNPLCPARSNQ